MTSKIAVKKTKSKKPLVKEKKITLYVAGLRYDKDEEGVMWFFTPFGYVESVQIIKDKNTKLPKGIAFVKMERESDGLKAIKGLDGTKVEGRTLKVSIANERPEYKKEGFISKSFEIKDKKKSVKEQNIFKAKAKAKNEANSKVGLNVLMKYKKSKT